MPEIMKMVKHEWVLDGASMAKVLANKDASKHLKASDCSNSTCQRSICKYEYWNDFRNDWIG